LDTTPETIVRKIDAILSELEDLRRAILEQSLRNDGNSTDRLYGALGHGSWEEYDRDLDWQRFAP
jgi:hypothetical protein